MANVQTYKKIHDIAVIVSAPTLNTDTVSLLEGLAKQSYPTTKYKIYVATHNDEVLPYAQKIGARIVSAGCELSKSEATEACIKAMLNDGARFDTYIVVENDTTLPYDYLANINNTLNEGVQQFNGCTLSNGERASMQTN